MASEPRWNVRRGLDRVFVVFAVCWYIVAGLVLWPQWLTAIRAQRDAAEYSHGGKSASVSPPPAGYENYIQIPPPPPGYTVIQPDQSIDYDALAKKAGEISSTPAPTPKPALPSVYQFMAQVHARELRPVKLTVVFTLVPPAIYGFAAALLWIARGFRA